MRILNYVAAVFLVLAVVIQVLGRWHTRRAARSLLQKQKTLYSGHSEYADATPSDFPRADHKFYEEAQKAMTALGLHWVGDIENLKATRSYPRMRTFLRCFISQDGLVMAAVYHVKMRGLPGVMALLGLLPKDIRTCDFETEFKDGTFLATSNGKGVNRLATCTGIDAHLLEPATAIETLLARHRQELERHVKELGREALCMHSKEELLASQDRQEALKVAFKTQRGYLTQEDFERIRGKKLSAPQQELVDEFTKQRDKEREKTE